MANDIALKTGTEVALPGNAWIDAANEEGTRDIFGKLFKYVKGEYLAGEHEELVPLGTPMVVIMDKMLRGWLRWENKRVTGRVNTYAPAKEPLRKDCGDHDQDAWPINDKGQQVDPWSRTWSVLMLDRKGNMYTFSTSSNGGIQALKDLLNLYGAHIQALGNKGPTDYPVVSLRSDSYKHTKFGRVQVPLFEVNDYVPIAKVKEAVAAGLRGGALKGDPDVVESENPGVDLDDEIPF